MMARIYANLIIKGRKTMADVPEVLREAVQKILDEAGWEPTDAGDD